MARTSTLTELIAQVRARTDQEVDGAVDDTAHLTPWINNGIAAFWKEVTKTDPGWFLVTDTVSTTAGTKEYAVPADCMLIRGVEYESSGTTIELEQFPWQERNHGLSHGFDRGHIQPRYHFLRNGIDGTGARLVFRPDPGTRTYTIHYVPNPTKLAAGGDAFDGIAGFEEYVIEYACILVRNKQDEDPSPHERLLAVQQQNIQDLASERDVSGTARIARVRGRRRHFVRGFYS